MRGTVANTLGGHCGHAMSVEGANRYASGNALAAIYCRPHSLIIASAWSVICAFYQFDILHNNYRGLVDNGC